MVFCQVTLCVNNLFSSYFIFKSNKFLIIVNIKTSIKYRAQVQCIIISEVFDRFTAAYVTPLVAHFMLPCFMFNFYVYLRVIVSAPARGRQTTINRLFSPPSVASVLSTTLPAIRVHTPIPLTVPVA